MKIIILFESEPGATAVVGKVIGDEHFRFRADKQMDIAAFDFEVVWENIFVFKGHHRLVAPWKKNMITQQIQAGKKKCSDQIRAKKTIIAHARIEHGDHLSIARKAGRKKDDRDQGEDRPEQAIDIRDEIEIIVKQDFLFRHRFVHEFFNMLTEIDRDGDNRKEERGKEKRTQEFADDISVKYSQGRSWF